MSGPIAPARTHSHDSARPCSSDPHELGRALKARHVSMIAMGGIIGAGLFVGSSTSIAAVGPAVVISYLIAGLVILLVMRMLSEMAIANPGARSFTELIRGVLGDGAGFVTGWLYWYFWVVVVAIEAIAGAVILHQWLPYPVWLIGVGLLAVMTCVNLLSTRSYGEFEFWLASVKVGAILIFIAMAGAWAFGITAPHGSTFDNLTEHDGFAPRGWLAVAGGVTSVIFALCGAEIATIAAAESEEPERTIARMTSSVALRILLFYVVSISLIVCVLPWTQIVAGRSPFTAALQVMRIPGATTVMDLVVLVAVTSCLNSGLYVTSRVLFALAERGDAPGWLVRTNARQVPFRAVLAATLFGYLGLAASVLSPEKVFSFLVNASGATMLFIYVLVCLAQIAGRRAIEAGGMPRPSVLMWGFPWLSHATLGAILLVLAAMLAEAALRQQLLLSALVLGMVWAASILRERLRR